MPRKFTPTTTDRTALYVRVSSRGQEDGASLSTQLTACDALGQENGWDVLPAHVYRETFSGVELWERPELTRLRAAMAAGDLDHVICYSIDRLSRDPVHLGVILSEAHYRGVTITFVTEPLDDTPEGQLIQFVRGYAAKVEHEKIRERTTRGKIARVQSGRPLVGPRPLYGYQWRDEEKTGYAIDPVTSRVVLRIFVEYVDGSSLRQIVRSLYADGIPSPMGLPTWSTDAIRQMLRHPAYFGRAYGWGWNHAPGKRRFLDMERAIELPAGTVPAIVDQVLWDRAQARLVANRNGVGVTSRVPAGAVLLRGHVTCGSCGATMYVQRYRYQAVGATGDETPEWRYECRNKGVDGSCTARATIRAGELDAAAWEMVMRILTRPEWVRRQVEALADDDTVERDLAAVDAALVDVAKRRTNLTATAAMIDDDEGRAPIALQLTQLGERHQSLAAERKKILIRRQAWDEGQSMLDTFTDWGARVAANAERLSPADRRALVELLDVRAEVFPKGAPSRWVLDSQFTPAVAAGEVLGEFWKVTSTTTAARHFPQISLTVAAGDVA